MKKISAILVMVLVFAMTVVPASAADVTVALNTSTTTVANGDSIVINVTFTPGDAQIACLDGFVTYDSTLVVFDEDNDAGDFTVNASTPGKLVIGAASSKYYKDGAIGGLTFKAIADGKAEFGIEVDYTENYDGDELSADVTGVSVQIGDGGSSEPDPEPPVTKEFKVTAVENTDKTVVTVKDSSELPVGTVGTVYVANYVDDVLVSCESKPLADGDLEFAITGNVKVFVWDANNVPLVNEVIEL